MKSMVGASGSPISIQLGRLSVQLSKGKRIIDQNEVSERCKGIKISLLPVETRLYSN